MTAASPALVLVVDDDIAIRRLLAALYGMAGFAVAEAATVRTAVETAVLRRPDLVVLDLGLPDGDGSEVLARLREWSRMPVIVLSARAGEAEKVRLLDGGADDYVTKPFGSAELLARSRAVLRRSAVGEAMPTVVVGDLAIDLALRQVLVGGRPVALARKEYQLLALLAAHQGRVLTHGELIRDLWGPGHAEDLHYVRILMRKLRARVEAAPAQPKYLVTELGVGYRLRTNEQLAKLR